MRSFTFSLFLPVLLSFTIPAAVSEPPQEITSCDSIPPMNREIVGFVKSKLGKKTGTGQCWDLAAAALRSVNAVWDGQYVYGRKLDPEKECIYPGDIIQFEGVLIEYAKDGGWWQEEMGHHTAIIYQVNGPGNYELAHQNFGPSGKKAGITHLEIKNITKGIFMIYRPGKE